MCRPCYICANLVDSRWHCSQPTLTRQPTECWSTRTPLQFVENAVPIPRQSASDRQQSAYTCPSTMRVLVFTLFHRTFHQYIRPMFPVTYFYFINVLNARPGELFLPCFFFVLYEVYMSSSLGSSTHSKKCNVTKFGRIAVTFRSAYKSMKKLKLPPGLGFQMKRISAENNFFLLPQIQIFHQSAKFRLICALLVLYLPSHRHAANLTAPPRHHLTATPKVVLQPPRF